MAKVAQVKADWLELDFDKLSQGEQAAYQNYKALYRQMKEARTAFEELMNENARAEQDLPIGKKLVFGYNFGKLSVAVVADDVKPKAKAAGSLSDYLAGMNGQGRRA